MVKHAKPRTRDSDPEALLSRMEEEIVLRGFARGTRRLYVAHVRRFLEHSVGEPESGEAVRRWALALLSKGRSHSYVNQALSALRFFYRHVLDEPAPVVRVPRPKRKRQLPRVLSEGAVRRFLEALETPRNRAIAFTLYSSGMRVGEVVRLKVSDIDSDRMMIHVREGKGGKDRYVMLSPILLEILREYVRVERPTDWLFTAGHRRDRHITTRSVQRQVAAAADRAGINKKVTPHTLRHSFATSDEGNVAYGWPWRHSSRNGRERGG